MQHFYSRLAPALVPILDLILVLCAGALIYLRAGKRMDTAGFRSLERWSARLARRKTLAVVLIGICVVAIRTALIPLIGTPQPRWNDEFSYLLAAQTFALGRVTNPTPPMWTHFETFHIIERPTYTSMYPPGQGLILAGGQKLGNPWIGQLLTTALMCASISWMLQAWVPPRWALYGGVLAGLRLGILSYWMNSYWCASLAALGGALVLGSWPRIQRSMQVRHALIMGIGLALLANTRPFEGLVFSLPFAGAMLVGVARSNRQEVGSWLRKIALPLSLVLLATCSATGYYYYRVTGSPVRMAYQVNRETYAMAPYFIWEKLRPKPEYRQAIMREFYQSEVLEYQQNLTVRGYLFRLAKKFLLWWRFYLGPLLTIPLIAFPSLIRQRKMRLPVLLLIATIAGIAVQVFMLPHYFAPATGLLYLFLVQGARWLAQCSVHGRLRGHGLVRAIPILACAMVLLRVVAIMAHVQIEPAWYRESKRAEWLKTLETRPGPQLVLIHYGPHADGGRDWVYNGPDIDKAKIVWANDMGDLQNRELINYFRDRTVWLAFIDDSQYSLQLYSLNLSREQGR